ncbi:MAG: tyrosine-type recombinase/integrase [Streptosporangiaceae bacterium]
MAHLWPTHHENVLLYGTHTAAIDAELAGLDATGYRPLRLPASKIAETRPDKSPLSRTPVSSGYSDLHEHPAPGNAGDTRYPVHRSTRGGAMNDGQPGRDPVPVTEAIETFLAIPRYAGPGNTYRAYAGVLFRLADHLGARRMMDAIDDEEIASALETLWGSAAPATWNRNRAIVASWLSWCRAKARWPAPGVPPACERRREPGDQTRAVTVPVIERICTRRDIPLRERLLWRMLYETASRASAVLALNIEDCDFENRRAAVTVKGGDTAWVVWGRGTALLLPRYLRGREAGPLFCSGCRPGPKRTAATPARDLCPGTGRMRLGYDRARVLIRHYTGLSLHQLRHSAATHLGEKGVDATVIMAKTHHRSIRTVARYTRPGLAAVTDATALLDPPQRRG